jgi:hypothetical protein
MTHPLLQSLIATFNALAAEARKHSIGGAILPDDLQTIYKRTAQKHGATPEDVRRWIEAR